MMAAILMAAFPDSFSEFTSEYGDSNLLEFVPMSPMDLSQVRM